MGAGFVVALGANDLTGVPFEAGGTIALEPGFVVVLELDFGAFFAVGGVTFVCRMGGLGFKALMLTVFFVIANWLAGAAGCLTTIAAPAPCDGLAPGVVGFADCKPMGTDIAPLEPGLICMLETVLTTAGFRNHKRYAATAAPPITRNLLFIESMRARFSLGVKKKGTGTRRSPLV